MGDRIRARKRSFARRARPYPPLGYEQNANAEFAQNDRQDTSVKSEVDKLLEKNQPLNHLEMAKVVSHVQRDKDGWVLNTLMLDGYDVPFRYSRKKRYRSLKGARVNITYYPQAEQVAGIDVEVMKVVRLKRS